MIYYKYRDKESLIGDGTRYIEADEGWSVREVTVSSGAYFGSNVKYPCWDLCMADCQTNYNELLADEPSQFEIQEITEREFEQVWNEHLNQNEGRWRLAKHAFPIGKQVRGRIVVFYPQGVIVDLGDSVLGVANLADCNSSVANEILSTGHHLSATVAGYDDKYQWLVLEKPEVKRKMVGDQS